MFFSRSLLALCAAARPCPRAASRAVPRATKMVKQQKVDKDDQFLDAIVQANSISTKQQIVFYANAFAVAAVPVYLFSEVFDMPLDTFAVLFVAVTAVATYLLSYAYSHATRNHRIELGRTREDLASDVVKNAGKKAKKEDLQRLQDEATSAEAAAHSLWTLSAYFLVTVLAMAFFIFARATAPYNYALSVTASAGLWAVVSMANY